MEIEITPAPTDEEREAILTALAERKETDPGNGAWRREASGDGAAAEDLRREPGVIEP